VSGTTKRSIPRRDRLVQERDHDTYASREKLSEPTVCPGCGAAYRRGRWQWVDQDGGGAQHLCPACCRIRDHQPAGVVTLGGPFFVEHSEEIVGLVGREAAQMEREHPLHRIMGVEEEGETMVLQTTDVHLGRRLGEAVHHAYGGELTVKYADDERLVRVRWWR